MVKLIGTPGAPVDYKGIAYWWRITSFTAGATLNIDSTVLPVDCREGMVAKRDKPYKQISSTGTVSIEIGEDPEEAYPGITSA